MSRIFGIWKKKFKDSNGTVIEKYYACSKTNSIVDTEELAERISSSCSLTQADVLGCLKALSIEMKLSFNQGSNIKLDGIGTFGIGISSEGFDDPKKIDPKKVKATKITYKADRKLSKEIKEMKFVAEQKPPKGYIAKSAKTLTSIALLVFFLSLAQMGFSQNKTSTSKEISSKDFNHTIQTQLGYRWIDGYLGSYSVKTNLIPSYELDYKNTYFAKLRYITYSEDYTGNIYLVDYNVYNPIRSTRLNLFSLVLSYNFLNTNSSHILKLGLDLGYGLNNMLFEGDIREYYNYFGVGGELSYKYFITDNIGLGGEINYGYVFGNNRYHLTHGANFTLSFRF